MSCTYSFMITIGQVGIERHSTGQPIFHIYSSFPLLHSRSSTLSCWSDHWILLRKSLNLIPGPWDQVVVIAFSSVECLLCLLARVYLWTRISNHAESRIEKMRTTEFPSVSLKLDMIVIGVTFASWTYIFFLPEMQCHREAFNSWVHRVLPPDYWYFSFTFNRPYDAPPGSCFWLVYMR